AQRPMFWLVKGAPPTSPRADHVFVCVSFLVQLPPAPWTCRQEAPHGTVLYGSPQPCHSRLRSGRGDANRLGRTVRGQRAVDPKVAAATSPTGLDQAAASEQWSKAQSAGREARLAQGSAGANAGCQLGGAARSVWRAREFHVYFSRAATPGDHAKKKTLTSSEQQDPKVQEERQRWRRRTACIDPERFKFLDQTNAKTTFTRLYGRARRGQRVREFVPDGRWYSLTLMGTLGWEGDTTAFLYEGGTDVMAMLTFVQHLLAPHLRPRHILVLDRLSSHLDANVIEAIAKTGAAVWHLPPYSHDLNPIEQMWSKIKAYLRKVKPRDTESLIAAIG